MLAREDERPLLGSLCTSLATEAHAAHEVPESLANEACRVTLSALDPLGEAPLSERDCARVRAYFWSVVRRRALRMRSASHFTARVVRQSIVEDLRRAGLEEDRIARELDRCAV